MPFLRLTAPWKRGCEAEEKAEEKEEEPEEEGREGLTERRLLEAVEELGKQEDPLQTNPTPEY